DTPFEKKHAEYQAFRVEGVAAVVNGINVSLTEASVDDRTLKEQIEEAWYWDAFVDERNLDISVRRGKAVLTGSVDTVYELISAVRNAYRAGAESVSSRNVKIENKLYRNEKNRTDVYPPHTYR
ncbi:MAG: BON domain-containing protein, partial [Elusimicrobia bacterium]|nr:BON domain-containing protein [Elusimicrobiota bacterium]